MSWCSTASTRRSASSTSAGRSRCSAAIWPRSSTSSRTPRGKSQWLNLNFTDWRELSELKAEFEPDEYDWIHTVRFQMAVPRIIRLLGYDKLPRQDVKFNRRNIFARDCNRCQYCGKKFPTTELSLDHVIPKSQGGKSTWENIVCCCIKCNVKKGGRTPEQASMHLITKPVKPQALAGDQHPPGR